MLNQVQKTIDRYNMLSLNDKVVAGVSGGPDSIALLHCLYMLRDIYNLDIYAAHLNHMLRGRESDEDTVYVEEFCRNLGIPCRTRFVDISELMKKTGLSLEEAGRMARYELFMDIAKDVGGAKIALAHNMNDQAETVLMRIMRGTGLDGLAGIKPVREEIFIRPLLFTLRSDIEKYCSENGLLPRIDSTNLVPVYYRNKIRLELIPYIKENFSHNIESSISIMAELIREDSDFLEGYIRDVFKDVACVKQDGIAISIDKTEGLHGAVKKRLIRFSIESVKGNLIGIESKHIDLVLSILHNKSTGAAVELPGGIKARISYNHLNIIKLSGETNFKFDYDLNIPGTTFVPENGCRLEADICSREGMADYKSSEKHIKYFDYDKIGAGLAIRTRQEGDYIVPLGMSGRKKLKDFFIDSKIPREDRDKIPLISLGSQIIWVIGYKINDNYKVTGDTQRILKLEYMQSGGDKHAK